MLSDQWDQTLHLKVAQFRPKWPQKVAKAVFMIKEVVFNIAQKVKQYLG